MGHPTDWLCELGQMKLDTDRRFEIIQALAQQRMLKLFTRQSEELELKDDLKGDLSGNFEHILVALVTPPAVFDAKQLKKCIQGPGTNEDVLIEILTTRTSRQMKEISQAYYTVYRKSLGDDISSETSGDFQKALLTLADGRRDESLKVDEHLAKKGAQILYDAGEKRWGTDEEKFIEVLCLRSFPQLKQIHCARNTPAYLAARLHQALKGAGTDEYTLNRIMVSRSKIDLLDIRAEFKKLYGYSLCSAIESDTSGDYGITLAKICGGDD
ncbi:annexin A3 isoform X3 [Echinops telfairi]|uniref:Annexin A3 isoform X3 n=1 Tax=Echinops telfairi TaxID=9371 RepID=A0AC55CJ49_ECHTE|nr:annexin A3 isoform X3 [Echinops telfairi]